MKKGFTLIELSIVLVIIGLLVSGVLVGRDLIQAAEIRSVISDIEKFSSATNAFRTKYNCLPGDCLTANSYFSSVTNGDGDGKIGTFNTLLPGDSAPNISERFQYWFQLASAGLVSGTYTGAQAAGGSGGWGYSLPGTNVPASRLGPAIGYTLLYYGGYTDGNDWSPCVACKINRHVIMFGRSNNTSSQTYGAAFSPQVAYAIDSKMDDGIPGTGSVIHPLPVYLANCVSTGNPTTSVYLLTTTGNNCSLYFLKLF